MPLPLSLVQPYRQNKLFVGSGWRAFFAPFNTPLAVAQSSTAIGPTIYDLQVLGQFTENVPPPGWFDLGLIDKFAYKPGSKIGSVKTGYRMATRSRYRGDVGEKCSFTFREFSHIAMKIASGGQVFNLLKGPGPASLIGPLSSAGAPAVPVGSGGYALSGNVSGFIGQPTLYVAAGSGAAFAAGSFIVCDQDYAGQSGYVGDAGAWVFPGAVNDIDYMRKTSDYVATVRAVVGDALVLTRPFIGGGCQSVPQAPVYVVPETNPASRGAKVQKVSGYSGRSGGTYIKEWSGVFVKATIDGSQLLVYYPRLSPDDPTGFEETAIENITSEQTTGQMCNLEALAFDDPEDGETVCSYTAYFPSGSQVSDFQS